MENSCIVLLIFVVLIWTAEGRNWNSNDKVWKERANKAKKVNQEAYTSDPYEVMDHLNRYVQKSVDDSNNTRRWLRLSKGGACVASNPIDKCWRCQKDWNKKRRRLADCVLGFGRNTTGGKAGKTYVVTDSSDADMVNPKKGTLRYGVVQKEPLWIIFKRDMVIRLSEELIIASNKTIDGRGAQVHITNGAGVTIQYVSNVIIHNIRIRNIKAAPGGMIRDSVSHYGFRTESDGDAITIFGSSNVWIDHVSLSNCSDGLIDVVQASTAVTISNCHFTQHNDVLLFGASNKYSADKIMQVTVAFNHFGKGLIQRMPRVRYGFVHIVNNDYTKWEMYAVGGSQNPTILSQGNRFVAPENKDAKEVTKREYTEKSVWKNWVWKSDGDIMKHGAFFVESGDSKHMFKMGDNAIAPLPGSMVKTLTLRAGPLTCFKLQPC